MDKVIQYLKSNPEYITALIITAVVLIVACVAGFFIKKYNLLSFMDGWFKKKTDLPEPTPEVSEDADNPIDEPTDEAEEFQDSFDTQADDIDLPSNPEEIAEEQPSPTPTEEKKPSRLAEMIKKSLETDTAKEYEEAKKLTPTPTPAKPTPKEDTPEQPIHQEEKPEGKWRIMRNTTTYTAELYNDEEVLLLRSEKYSNLSGAKSAIETLKKNVKGNNFSIAVIKGKFIFKLFSKSGRLICSGEPTDSRTDCIARIEEVKKLAFTAEVVRG